MRYHWLLLSCLESLFFITIHYFGFLRDFLGFIFQVIQTYIDWIKFEAFLISCSKISSFVTECKVTFPQVFLSFNSCLHPPLINIFLIIIFVICSFIWEFIIKSNLDMRLLNLGSKLWFILINIPVLALLSDLIFRSEISYIKY